MKSVTTIVRDAFHRSGAPYYNLVYGVIWTLIVVSIGIFGVELYFGPATEQWMWLQWLDWSILVVFVVEISVRVLTFQPAGRGLYRRNWFSKIGFEVFARIRYLGRPLNLIDLLAVLAVWQPLRGLRALRLLRLIRSVGLFKYSSPVGGIARAFKDNAFLYWMAFSFLGILTLIGGLSLYLIEGQENKDIDSVGDGIWWALVTLTTVGFGDISPESFLGRVVGGVLMIMGMFTLATFAGIVGNTLLNAILSIRQEQFRMSQYVNHVLVFGYDAGSRMLLDALELELSEQDSQVVIFASGIRPASLPEDLIWISGDPTKESELDKVRLADARAVIVVGNRSLSPAQADAQSILTVFTTRAYLAKNKKYCRRTDPIQIVAEILDGENVEHAYTAGADEVVESTRVGFSLLAHAISVPGASQIMSRVVVAGSHNLYMGSLPSNLDGGISFFDMTQAMKREYGVLVIGVRRDGMDQLNPKDQMLVGGNDLMIYLAQAPITDSVVSR